MQEKAKKIEALYRFALIAPHRLKAAREFF